MKRQKILKGKLSAIEQWGRNKFYLLAEFAQMAAISANEFYALLNATCEKKQLSPDPVKLKGKDWCKLSRRHHRVEKILFEFLRKDIDDKEFIQNQIDIFEIIRWCNNWNPDSFEIFKKELSILSPSECLKTGESYVKEHYQSHMQMIQQELYPENVQSEDLSHWVNLPEFQFFLQITMPCWFEYQMPIGRLVWKARKSIKNGEAEAIEWVEKLLHLDGRFIHDEVIGEYYSELEFNRKKFSVERLLNAMKRPPRVNCSITNVKYFLSGAIFWMSTELEAGFAKFPRELFPDATPPTYKRIKLKIPEIRGLFDAIAQDLYGKERDIDLPEFDNTFQMGVRRSAKLIDRAMKSYKIK